MPLVTHRGGLADAHQQAVRVAGVAGGGRGRPGAGAVRLRRGQHGLRARGTRAGPRRRGERVPAAPCPTPAAGSSGSPSARWVRRPAAAGGQQPRRDTIFASYSGGRRAGAAARRSGHPASSASCSAPGSLTETADLGKLGQTAGRGSTRRCTTRADLDNEVNRRFVSELPQDTRGPAERATRWPPTTARRCWTRRCA